VSYRTDTLSSLFFSLSEQKKMLPLLVICLIIASAKASIIRNCTGDTYVLPNTCQGGSNTCLTEGSNTIQISGREFGRENITAYNQWNFTGFTTPVTNARAVWTLAPGCAAFDGGKNCTGNRHSIANVTAFSESTLTGCTDPTCKQPSAPIYILGTFEVGLTQFAVPITQMLIDALTQPGKLLALGVYFQSGNDGIDGGSEFTTLNAHRPAYIEVNYTP
jgi:hypothetical protein